MANQISKCLRRIFSQMASFRAMVNRRGCKISRPHSPAERFYRTGRQKKGQPACIHQGLTVCIGRATFLKARLPVTFLRATAQIVFYAPTALILINIYTNPFFGEPKRWEKGNKTYFHLKNLTFS